MTDKRSTTSAPEGRKPTVQRVTLPSAYDNSNIFSRNMHLWVWPFMFKHYNKNLKVEDLHRCPKYDRSEYLGEKLEQYWEEELIKSKAKNRKPSLAYPIVRMFGWYYFIISIFCVIGYLMPVIQALCMGQLISDLETLVSLPDLLSANDTISDDFDDEPDQDQDQLLQKLFFRLYANGFGIVITQLLVMLAINPYYFQAGRYGMNIRVACCSLIYRKSLRLSKSSFLQTTAGQIVNLLSNDVNRFDLVTIYLPFIPFGFLLTAISLYLLWDPLGFTTIWGVCVLLLYVPLQAAMGKAFSRLRASAAQLTDERVRLMNEFIPAMRVIKMYTWERPFSKLVDAARRREISKIRRSAYLRAMNLSLFFAAAKIIVFIIFAVWVLDGGHLDARTVFVCMNLMNQLRLAITLMVPNAISTMAEAMISMDRIRTFLLLPERQENSGIQRNNFLFTGIPGRLTVNGISATYKNEIGPMNEVKNQEVSGNDQNGNLCSKKMKELNGHTNPLMNQEENESNKTLPINQSINEQETETEGFMLKNVNLTCEQNELSVIVGPVGAGKSSVLMAILGEMNVLEGNIQVTGRVSYASQEPWTFAGTVRENILFNALFDQVKYDEVIRVSALQRDLELLAEGDRTIVGDRGVTLSGGQRARINLARALYLDADIYLLDDPLSAVDAHVAKHIFDEAIRGYLSRKIVLLVTHQLQFVKNADRVLLLKHGRQLAFGDYNTLLGQLNSETALSQMLGDTGTSAGASGPLHGSQPLLYREPSVSSDLFTQDPFGSNLSLSSQLRVDELSVDNVLIDSPKKDHSIQKIINSGPQDVHASESDQQTEPQPSTESQLLSASKQAYIVYFFQGNFWVGFWLLISFIISQTLFSGSDYWLSLWTDYEEHKHQPRDVITLNDTVVVGTHSNTALHPIIEHFTPQQNVAIYAGQMIGLFVFSFIRGVLFFVLCMRSSVRLHDRLFNSIVRAPMSFFDRNPIGTLLNRCSRDMGIIDEILPPTSFDAIGIIITDIGIFTMLVLLNYWIVLPFFLLIILIMFIRTLYVRTGRQIKLLEGVTKSPVFSQLSSSLYGLTTIRAFNAQKRFEHRFDLLQNDHSSAWFFYITTIRWFLFAMDIMSVFLVAGVTTVMLVFADSSNGSLVGLVISSTLMFAGGFQWCMKQWTEVETQMTSVDRVHEYSNIPSEGGLATETIQPPPEWPPCGKIEFRNVTMNYEGCSKAVLRNLNFTINPRQKVGIVGRTGAGKSSIIAAIFRLNECEGEIVIDDLDTKHMPLESLRQRLAIIPQEPVIFTGTVRSNLDPFGQHSDDRLWSVLKEIQLQRQISDMPGGLDAKITDGGTNFSVGQKQLLCLARAMLRQNRVLILDEATANCDPKTDELIQRTIRTVFSDCTIITIAHRLHTVMDADQVLVLDAGQLKEFDSPSRLLQQPNSIFRGMVNATGKETARTLRRMASLNQRLRLEQNSSDEEELDELQEEEEEEEDQERNEIEEEYLEPRPDVLLSSSEVMMGLDEERISNDSPSEGQTISTHTRL